MKNAMQLKAVIKNIAVQKKISPQLAMQNYMLEKLLERISISKYQPIFILKGGFLIAAMVGIDTRATMDIDATLKGFPVNEETVKVMFTEIASIDIDDQIKFVFISIEEIREGDQYTGYRVHLKANFEKMSVPLKLDITTGDKITPREIEFTYKSAFNNKEINILAYNKETILAEKIETVISRGDQNTRPRDYYDIYILNKLFATELDYNVLRQSIKNTSEKRGSYNILQGFDNILQQVSSSPIMLKQWQTYQKNYSYAQELDFEETIKTVRQIMREIF